MHTKVAFVIALWAPKANVLAIAKARENIGRNVPAREPIRLESAQVISQLREVFSVAGAQCNGTPFGRR